MELYTIQFSNLLDNCLSEYQKYQNLMLDGFYDTKHLIYSFYSDFIMNNVWIRAIQQGLVSLALQNLSCTLSSLLRRKMSSNYYSIDTIASALSLDKSIVSQVLQDLIPDCKFPYSSHPSKLSD